MKTTRTISKQAQRIIEKLLSGADDKDPLVVELIPVRIKANPLSPRQGVNFQPGISPGTRITVILQADAESGQLQHIAKKSRRLGVVDKRIIEETLSNDKRIRLLPVESGVKLVEVSMRTLRMQEEYRV